MPKKKGGKKGAKVIDGVATNEMTREQLMGHVKRMQTELNREREERNFYMLEREKLYALWQITSEQLESAKTDVRLADAKMDDHELERENAMHTYKQKLRFLLTEQSRRVTESRLHNLKHIRFLHISNELIQDSLRETIEGRNREISSYQTSMYGMMRELQLQNSQQKSSLRSDFCDEIRRIESTFQRLLYEHEQSSEIHINSEVSKMKQEKSKHIQQIMELYNKQIQEMKSYFNEVTTNNFAVIATLQEQLAQMRNREQELLNKVNKCQKDCKELEGEINKAKDDAEQRIQQDRKSAREFKRKLDLCDKWLKRNELYVRALEVNNEALLQKSETVLQERDNLRDSFVQSLIELQKKGNMKMLSLEMKLKTVTESGRDVGKSQKLPDPSAFHQDPDPDSTPELSGRLSKESVDSTSHGSEERDKPDLEQGHHTEEELADDSK